MFNINQPTVQMMGRYQPWHGGHRELFKQAMKRTGQVAIFVRNMPVNNDNPLKFEELGDQYQVKVRMFQIYKHLTIEQ